MPTRQNIAIAPVSSAGTLPRPRRTLQTPAMVPAVFDLANHLTEVIHAGGDAVIRVTSDRLVAAWTPESKRLYGYTAREAIRQPMEVLFHPDHLVEAKEIWNRVEQGQPVVNYDTLHVRQDGGVLEVSLSLCTTSTHAGRPSGFSMVVRDLTEFKRGQRLQSAELKRLREAAARLKTVERKLKESLGDADEIRELGSAAARYRELFEGAPEAYLVTDTEAVVREANQGAGTLFGVAPARLVGLPVAAMVSEADRRLLRGKLSDVRRGHGAERWDMRLSPHARPAFEAGVAVVLARDSAGGPSMMRWIIRELVPSGTVGS